MRRTFGNARQQALEWIAFNDDPGELDPNYIEKQISVCLVADVFGLDRHLAAVMIIQIRKNQGA